MGRLQVFFLQAESLVFGGSGHGGSFLAGKELKGIIGVGAELSSGGLLNIPYGG
jgi:hypothetical protein